MLFLKYDIVQEVLENLAPNYKKMLSNHNDKAFLYVNCIEILRYYRLTKIKPFVYDLYNKVNYWKKDLFLLNMINETKKNNYYKPNITFLYCVAISFSVDEILKKHSLDGYSLALDTLYAKKKGLNLTNKYIYNTFNNCFLFSLTELDFLSNCLRNTYNESATTAYASEAINQFKQIMCGNPLYIISNKIKDLFRKKEYKSKNFKYKRLNIKNKTYYELVHKNIDFDILKQEILNEANILLEAVNQALYFNKQESLVEIATNNSWNGIVNYYNFLNEQTQIEKERKKAYKIKNKTLILNQKIKEALKRPN